MPIKEVESMLTFTEMFVYISPNHKQLFIDAFQKGYRFEGLIRSRGYNKWMWLFHKYNSEGKIIDIGGIYANQNEVTQNTTPNTIETDENEIDILKTSETKTSGAGAKKKKKSSKKTSSKKKPSKKKVSKKTSYKKKVSKKKVSKKKVSKKTK